MLIKAATIIAKLANVPSSSPNSKALDVPAPCAPIPNIKPLDDGLWNRHILITIGANRLPKMPVVITKTAVKVGEPPIIFEMSIAIGVVTERGTKLCTSSLFNPTTKAIMKDEIMATVEPTAILIKISNACFLIN